MGKSLLAALLMLLALPAWAQPPVVAVSIQPLHSLAAQVMKGVAEPRLVVTGAQSEHTYALKPSDARLLAQAGLVVLVDEHYESFLAKPLAARKGETLAMAELPGITLLPQRAGGVWEKEHDEHGHHHHAEDGHIWLDPMNAKVLVAALAERLSRMDPANAKTYAANAAEAAARLDRLDADVKARLAPVADKGFVVFHDAYQYFERRYGLAAAGSVTVDPDRPPSARRLAELKTRLKGACIFREPQFPAPVVDALAQAAGARQGVLDPQGADIPPGPDLYSTLMTRLADSLKSCLSAG